MICDIAEKINKGRTCLGIEFGSTRIKAVLIDDASNTLARGIYDWEISLVDGIWTYSQSEILTGLKGVFKSLKEDVRNKYGVNLKRLESIGISGMMHGYIVLDENNDFLVPFRTWRNTITYEAAEILTEKFGFRIPQRWSVAHLYQAVLNRESHIGKIKYITTLSGYIHYLLTGEKVIGIGEASGMFPIDGTKLDYNDSMIAAFDSLIKGKTDWKIREILPRVLTAGENAGRLRPESVKLIDESGELESGIPLCPPEGDAGTGMVATNSVRERTENISAGTSAFSMFVLEKPLNKIHSEIDIVSTPSGKEVAMVHCNNCTSDINAWINILKEFTEKLGLDIDMGKLFELCFKSALEGDKDCGGLVSFNNVSGEPITGVKNGRPMFLRESSSKFTFENFFLSHLYSACAGLKIGMDILTRTEDLNIDRLMGHGGFFKTETVGQTIMANALNTPVSVMDTAGEGGAWGIAVLAKYMADGTDITLEDYLDKIFGNYSVKTVYPDKERTEGFNKFISNYKRDLWLAGGTPDNSKSN